LLFRVLGFLRRFFKGLFDLIESDLRGFSTCAASGYLWPKWALRIDLGIS
jgi:hypothetical protein